LKLAWITMGCYPPHFALTGKGKNTLAYREGSRLEGHDAAHPKIRETVAAGPTAAQAYWLRNLYNLPAPELGELTMYWP